jgi:hypothetical protein
LQNPCKWLFYLDFRIGAAKELVYRSRDRIGEFSSSGATDGNSLAVAFGEQGGKPGMPHSEKSGK